MTILKLKFTFLVKTEYNSCGVKCAWTTHISKRGYILKSTKKDKIFFTEI